MEEMKKMLDSIFASVQHIQVTLDSVDIRLSKLEGRVGTLEGKLDELATDVNFIINKTVQNERDIFHLKRSITLPSLSQSEG